MLKAVATAGILAVLLSAAVLAVSPLGPSGPTAPTGPGTTQAGNLTVSLRVNPETLNNASNGRWVTARLNFSEEVARDVDNASLRLEGIAADRMQVLDNTSVMAKFPRAELIAILPIGVDVQVCLTGTLKDGRTFESCDTIRVIGRP